MKYAKYIEKWTFIKKAASLFTIKMNMRLKTMHQKFLFSYITDSSKILKFEFEINKPSSNL